MERRGSFLGQTLKKFEPNKVKLTVKFVQEWNYLPLQLGTGEKMLSDKRFSSFN